MQYSFSVKPNFIPFERYQRQAFTNCQSAALRAASHTSDEGILMKVHRIAFEGVKTVKKRNENTIDVKKRGEM